eukprot:11157888-Lingulodinium_polyedra.AAC.1
MPRDILHRRAPNHDGPQRANRARRQAAGTEGPHGRVTVDAPNNAGPVCPAANGAPTLLRAPRGQQD